MKKLGFLLISSYFMMLPAFAQDDISDLRENYNVGDEVTISGIVTNNDDLGSIRYIQDESAGIAIYPGFNWNNLPFTPQQGDIITVTGEISEFANLLEVGPNISSLTLESSGNPLPTPLTITPEDFDEDLEGMLVQIVDAVFADGGSTFASSTYNFTASEELGIIYVPSASPLLGELIPLGLIQMTGILSQFSFSDPTSGYQLLPRTMDDLISNSNINFGSEVEQTNLATTSFSLNWTTDVASTSEVEYGTTADYGSIVSVNDGTLDHSIEINNLEPGTPYFCRIFSVTQGEDTASATGTFSTVSESSGDIAVYFNRSVDTSVSTGTDAISLFSATDDTIIAQIDRAMSTLDMAGYNINSGTIIQALNNALDRGVTIRYIAEGQTANTALANLDDNIPVLIRQNATGSGMHNKFIVVDRNSVDSALVLTGSTNFTTNNLFTDPNNLIIIKDQSLARAYTIEFEEMWGGSGEQPNLEMSRFGEFKLRNTPKKFIIGGRDVELYFSPSDNTTTAIAEAISTTEYDLEFALLLLTNNTLADAIIAEANLFVQPRGLIEDINTTGSDYQDLVSNGINVLAHEGFNQLHHKYGIIDHSQPESDPIVITGSHNWTSSAESVNDENTLIIHDATIANLFHQEFTARYNDITLSTTDVSKQKVELYPNPAENSVNISFEGLGGLSTISMFSVEGRLVEQFSFQSYYGPNKVLVDVSSVPNGFYTIQYKEGNRTGSEKLVIFK